MTPPVLLIVTDVARTLGNYTGLTAKQILGSLSPRTPDDIRHIIRYGLQIRQDEEAIPWTCSHLMIPRYKFPTEWPATGFDPYPYTNRCLHALEPIAPIVALTNTECTAGPQRIAELDKHCGQYIQKIYTSYEMGGRKPEQWLWRLIGENHLGPDYDPGSIVTIGDRWTEDVLGPLAAGCRAILVLTGDEHIPTPLPAGPDRLRIVTDLVDAVPVVREWAGQRR